MTAAETFLDPLVSTANEKVAAIEKSISQYAKDSNLTPAEQRTLAQTLVYYLDVTLEGISRETLSVSKIAEASKNLIEYVLKGALESRNYGRELGQDLSKRMAQENRVENFLGQTGGVAGMAFGLGLSVAGKGKGGKGFKGTKSLSKKDVPENVNAQVAMNKKMSALEDAQRRAIKVKTLPDGRVRYYEQMRPAKSPGETIGSSYVTEYNSRTGQVRSWNECYNKVGKVNRVNPKMIDGQKVSSTHYPMTKKEIEFFKNK